MGLGAFVIGLSQISTFFSYRYLYFLPSGNDYVLYSRGKLYRSDGTYDLKLLSVHVYKGLSIFFLHGSRKDKEYYMVVGTPADRPKFVCNRCVIEVLVVFLCCQVAIWIFLWVKGICHRTESDLFLFLYCHWRSNICLETCITNVSSVLYTTFHKKVPILDNCKTNEFCNIFTVSLQVWHLYA